MKKLAIFLFTKCLFIQSINAQSWTPMSVGSPAEVYFMSFPANDTGYVSLSNGTLRKTTNGALSWAACNTMSPGTSDLEFTSGLIGFMFADSGVVMTTNGAQSWSYVLYVDYGFDICFANQSVGYVSAINNTFDTVFVYKTIDGGTTWNAMPEVTGPFNAFEPRLYFISATDGFMCAEGHTLKTTDGGQSWNSVYLDPAYDMFISIHSPDGINVFTGYYQASFNSSIDGGDNWNNVGLTNYPPSGLFFFNATNGFYCGGNGLGTGVIESTSNGGTTWTPVYTGNTLWCMDFPSSTTGYAAGTAGVIVKYEASSSGLVENGSLLVSVYPNPANDLLTLENISPGSEITLTNTTGQIVLTQTALYNRMQINVSALAEGYYMLQVKNENAPSQKTRLVISR